MRRKREINQSLLCLDESIMLTKSNWNSMLCFLQFCFETDKKSVEDDEKKTNETKIENNKINEAEIEETLTNAQFSFFLVD